MSFLHFSRHLILPNSNPKLFHSNWVAAEISVQVCSFSWVAQSLLHAYVIPGLTGDLGQVYTQNWDFSSQLSPFGGFLLHFLDGVVTHTLSSDSTTSKLQISIWVLIAPWFWLGSALGKKNYKEKKNRKQTQKLTQYFDLLSLWISPVSACF